MKVILKNNQGAEGVKILNGGDIITSNGETIKADDINRVSMSEDEFDNFFVTLPGGSEAGEDTGMYETYGEDIKEVKKMANDHPRRVWTILDGDDGTYLSSGFHFVNRRNYVLTENEVPWEIDDIQIGSFHDISEDIAEFIEEMQEEHGDIDEEKLSEHLISYLEDYPECTMDNIRDFTYEHINEYRIKAPIFAADSEADGEQTNGISIK